MASSTQSAVAPCSSGCGHPSHEGYACGATINHDKDVFCFCGVEKGWGARPKAAPSVARPLVEPYTEDWYRLALDLAQNFCPPIYPCPECRGPKVQGYACTHCGYKGMPCAEAS